MFTFSNQNDSCFTLPNSSWSQLIIDTSYYWMTRTAGGPTQWCSSSIGPLKRLYAALPPDTLIYPINGGTGVSLTTLLDWEKINSATSYKVRIYNTPSQNFLILDTTVNNDSMYVAEGNLISNQKYWWKVKPLKTGGQATLFRCIPVYNWHDRS